MRVVTPPMSPPLSPHSRPRRTRPFSAAGARLPIRPPLSRHSRPRRHRYPTPDHRRPTSICSASSFGYKNEVHYNSLNATEGWRQVCEDHVIPVIPNFPKNRGRSIENGHLERGAEVGLYPAAFTERIYLFLRLEDFTINVLGASSAILNSTYCSCTTDRRGAGFLLLHTYIFRFTTMGGIQITGLSSILEKDRYRPPPTFSGAAEALYSMPHTQHDFASNASIKLKISLSTIKRPVYYVKVMERSPWLGLCLDPTKQANTQKRGSLCLSHSTPSGSPPKGIDRMGMSVQVTPLSGAYGEVRDPSATCSPSMASASSSTAAGPTSATPPTSNPWPAKVAPTIDAVLLSHTDIMHLGALPYAMKHLGLSAPVYATEPQVSDFDLFTLDDIDAAFQNVVRLKYSQNHLLNDKGEGIVIAPHVAGHDLGGTVRKITKDGEDVVYAVDFNQRKERHLNGTALGSFVRPAVLITDAYNALNNHVYKRQQDQDFIGTTLDILNKEEEKKASFGPNAKASDPMVIDASTSRKPSNSGSKFGGNVDILIDGFVPPSSSVAPMFPFFENTSEWDDFGEVINPEDYLMKQEEMYNTLMPGAGDGMDNMLDEGSARLLLDSTPSKVISNEMTVQVKCSLAYMDFEGRSDGRSVKSVIAHVAPLKLVLVHGSAEATEHLKMHCSKSSDLHVYAPQIEETIDVTSDLCSYKVQLSEKLMSNVISKKLGEHEIAWVDAEVGKADDKLTLLPPSSTPAAHKSVLVGDLKLADFKQFLANKGLQVEFAGGALRCGEYITLRKIGDAGQKGSTGSQQIVIEGPLCEDYYKIRELLYSQFYLL
uniref:Cleavage and polyadenylation specificity factor subunit 2 n=1 Tax=Oryza meridionalis TaxID=40149 RepID=A0A0E0CG54_9ORYZ